jgi:hypothetical protein
MHSGDLSSEPPTITHWIVASAPDAFLESDHRSRAPVLRGPVPMPPRDETSGLTESRRARIEWSNLPALPEIELPDERGMAGPGLPGF